MKLMRSPKSAHSRTLQKAIALVADLIQLAIPYMTDRTFVDTNILIYAHDISAAQKHVKAAALVRGLWETRKGVLSTQVLQEFYVYVTRKLPNPIAKAKSLDL